MKIVFPIKYIYHNDTEKSADSQQQKKKESTACRFHFPVETDIGLLTLKSQRNPTVREIYDLRRVDYRTKGRGPRLSARGGAGRLAAPILPITPIFGWTVWRVFIDRWRNDSLVARQVLFFSSQWYRTNGGRVENPDIMSSSRGQCLCFEWMFIQLWSLIPPLKKKCFNVHIHKIHGYCFKYKQYLREGKNTWQGKLFIHTVFL